MEDRARFDALLFAPMPGRAQAVDPDRLAAETADLRRMAAWANTVGG